MASPYQLILLNLIHLFGVLLGTLRCLTALRPKAAWVEQMQAWLAEQERELRVLIVLLKQIGGTWSKLQQSLFLFATLTGWVMGFLFSVLPVGLLKTFLRNWDHTLLSGFERAGHHIAIADLAEWQEGGSINPPKTLLELAEARRAWPSNQAMPVSFL